MKKVVDFISKYMSLIVLGIAVLALFVPATFTWIQMSWIEYLLMIIMFGMGLTLKPADFLVVFRRPKDIIVGCIAQFTIMPLLAFLLGKIFSLDTALMAGVILVGACPGGTASNVITYLSGGDVALSVGMTSINTLLAPFLTPAITYLLLSTRITVNVPGMFISIFKVVIIPIVLGFIINYFLEKYTRKISGILPLISVFVITMTTAAVVSHNSSQILTMGALVCIIVILHNLLGFGAGFLLAVLFKMPMPRKKALAIEIGMQNSGLATSLAANSFPELAMATVPGALFSVWHNISGAILANILRRYK